MSGWIMTIVVVVVAICAGLAIMGFKGRITTVGIDLGTTYSVVGFSKDNKVVIVEDSEGHRLFPSIVSYLVNGDIKVGYDALPYVSSNPSNTIYNAKRYIGRSMQEADVAEYAAEHPYSVVEYNASDFTKIGFDITSTTSSSPEGSSRHIVSPEEVGTEVLKYLMRITSSFIGHDQVNKAVIAVPAKFNPFQRQATAAAYKRAGLKVIRVMEEPTAAAVAYRLHKRTDIHHILVYDFGGGTLDVSILYVAKGSVEVYATDGDDTLGGSDLDLCLFKRLKEQVYNTTSIDINTVCPLSQETGADCIQNPQQSAQMCTAAAVHTMAEDIKKQLTTVEVAQFSCLLPAVYKDQYASPAVSFPVHRSIDLEQACATIFERSMLPVSRLLASLEMDRTDIDEVVLVGGSTRIPKVKQQLREYFGKELNDHIDPDITVAYGAASVLD